MTLRTKAFSAIPGHYFFYLFFKCPILFRTQATVFDTTCNGTFTA